MEIPECFYRVSIKALILNETRDKFLICEEESGAWELPGGGLDRDASPQEDLAREVREEMGLKVSFVADHPSYFFTDRRRDNPNIRIVNVIYECEVENLDIIPSDECLRIKFVNEEDIENMNVFATIKNLAKVFNPNNHLRK